MSQEKDNQELVDFAVEARKYKTQLTENYKARKPWVAPDPKEVKAYIPGTIVSVAVKPGDSVKQGEVLLVLEAMKMQNCIEMPFDGVIKAVHVVPGDVIPKHFLMVEIA